MRKYMITGIFHKRHTNKYNKHACLKKEIHRIYVAQNQVATWWQPTQQFVHYWYKIVDCIIQDVTNQDEVD